MYAYLTFRDICLCPTYKRSLHNIHMRYRDFRTVLWMFPCEGWVQSRPKPLKVYWKNEVPGLDDDCYPEKIINQEYREKYYFKRKKDDILIYKNSHCLNVSYRNNAYWGKLSVINFATEMFAKSINSSTNAWASVIS